MNDINFSNKEFLEKPLNESIKDYINRLVLNKKKLNLTWNELAHIIFDNTGTWKSPETLRKRRAKLQAATKVMTQAEVDSKITNEYNKNQSEEDSLQNLLTQIRNERIRLADERSQLNLDRRRIQREETLKEIASDYADKMASKKILKDPVVLSDCKISNKVGILEISDWHYGIECYNAYNKFDIEICKKRVRKLLDKVIEHSITHKLEKIYVLNLSDLIAGRIHTQIRIQSRVDVITQTMDVAEILAEFLTELSAVAPVEYYDCLDNHSRLEPNKNESLDLESLTRIIPWYLKKRLTSDRISIMDNEFGPDIITCKVYNHNIIGVHGDNDKPATALDKLTLMTHRHYDLLCTAHLHHFNADEKNQSLIISNGSLMGVDTYAEKLRLTSDPSQNFIIATPANVAECIYRIVLN